MNHLVVSRDDFREVLLFSSYEINVPRIEKAWHEFEMTGKFLNLHGYPFRAPEKLTKRRDFK